MKVFKVICALFAFGFVSVSHAAVIFITEKDANGVTSLLGADNVEVNNKFYNVRFLDGTCIALFNGCEADDFVFNTRDSAWAASESLLSQVFVGSSIFDNRTELTRGCSITTYCDIFTIYKLDDTYDDYSKIVVTNNVNEPSSFEIDRSSDKSYYPRTSDTTLLPGQVFAVWSEPVEATAPGTAMVLLMGIAGLIVSQRRKQA
jgi:hypothetical protein